MKANISGTFLKLAKTTELAMGAGNQSKKEPHALASLLHYLLVAFRFTRVLITRSNLTP